MSEEIVDSSDELNFGLEVSFVEVRRVLWAREVRLRRFGKIFALVRKLTQDVEFCGNSWFNHFL